MTCDFIVGDKSYVNKDFDIWATLYTNSTYVTRYIFWKMYINTIRLSYKLIMNSDNLTKLFLLTLETVIMINTNYNFCKQ